MTVRINARILATTVALLLAAVVVTANQQSASAGTPTLLVTKTTDTNDGSCDDVDCSLREAIRAANISSITNDIIAIPAGVYELTLAGTNDDTAATGDLDIAYTTVLEGAGEDQTIIQGDGQDRVFEGLSTSSASFNDLTIQGGGSALVTEGGIRAGNQLFVKHVTVQHNFGTIVGGIRALGDDTLIEDTRIIDNVSGASGKAGGLYATGAELRMRNVEIAGNLATGFGSVAGLYSASPTSTLANLTITHNVAVGENTAAGLYVSTGNTSTIDGAVILDNLAIGSGGVGGFWNDGTTTANDLLVQRNRAGNTGVGGIYSKGSLAIDGIMVSDNIGGDGGVGGVASATGGISMINPVIVRNEAGILGVGGFVNSSLSVISHGTIVGNTAKLGGTGGVRANAAVNIEGSLIAENGPNNCSAALVSGGHNLEDTNTCGLTSTGDQASTDPLIEEFVPPGQYIPFFGPAVIVQPESPVVDGDTSCPPPADDALFAARPAGEACDIGAYEYDFYFVEATETPAPSETPSLTQLLWGDDDCDGDVDVNDTLEAARVDAGLDVSAAGDCPAFGESLSITGFPAVNWSDIDCDGTSDAEDWLRLLRYAANLPAIVPPNCPGIGFQFEVSRLRGE